MPGSLSDRLVARRTELGIDQKQAALMCGVSQPTFHHWETGRRPGEEYLVNIARFLGLEREDVVLLRSGVDPEEFIAQRIEGAAERIDDLARVLRLLRPGDPPPPASE